MTNWNPNLALTVRSKDHHHTPDINVILGQYETDDTPEVRLMKAVLVRALQDIVSPCGPTSDLKRFKREAIAYIWSREYFLYSFEYVCNELDMSADEIRKNVLKYIDDPELKFQLPRRTYA